MRNTPLGRVVTIVKSESAKSLQQTSTAQDTEIYQIVDDCQAALAGQFDWPFLKTRWDTTVTAGGRYTAFPTVSNLGNTVNINQERPCDAWVKWNAIWQPVVYGIDEYPEFNYLDSDRNQVLDPVQRWQFSDESKFEVWPLPASTASMRFVGQRQLTTLKQTATSGTLLVGMYYTITTFVGGDNFSNVGAVNNATGQVFIATGTTPTNWTNGSTLTSWNVNATLDLDDLLVALFSAAEYLTRKGAKTAPIVLAKANQRLMAQRGAYPIRTETYCIGRGEPLGRKAIRQVPLVLVAGSTH
jgi:hypothetical protein